MTTLDHLGARVLKRMSCVMEHPWVYRAWQAPFARQKFEPILRHNDWGHIRRVLDVGCGPGTNAGMFRDTDYVGLDFNPRYIETARQRFPGTFVVADARSYEPPDDVPFDFLLMNSLLHHIDTVSTARILEQMATLLTSDGHIHIVDLVLPEQRSIARFLAESDRGDFPRPWDEWVELFSRVFEPVVTQPFDVGWSGCAFWKFIYFKGRPRR